MGTLLDARYPNALSTVAQSIVQNTAQYFVLYWAQNSTKCCSIQHDSTVLGTKGPNTVMAFVKTKVGSGEEGNLKERTYRHDKAEHGGHEQEDRHELPNS
jgi:hypothetical protein